MAKSKHEHGKMDITEQEKTFEGFIKWTAGVIAASLAALVFLAIFNS